MNPKRDALAAAVGKKSEIIDLLDRHLGPQDQAWVVCDNDECLKHQAGRCTVYMVHHVPEPVPGKSCRSYEEKLQ